MSRAAAQLSLRGKLIFGSKTMTRISLRENHQFALLGGTGSSTTPIFCFWGRRPPFQSVEGLVPSTVPIFSGAKGPLFFLYNPILYYYFCPPDGVTFRVESHQRRRGNKFANRRIFPPDPGVRAVWSLFFGVAGDPKPFTESYRFTSSNQQLVLCEPYLLLLGP